WRPPASPRRAARGQAPAVALHRLIWRDILNLSSVFVGGGSGSAARYGMSSAASRSGWIAFPYATSATNVIGCFVMGSITESSASKFSVSQPTRSFSTTGIVGGFTTFSTFASETASHVEQGRAGSASSYAGSSLGSGSAASFGGFYAIVMAMNGQFEQAAVGIFCAMVLDSSGGRVARMTNTQSAFGEQMDSSSDMVSFGAAPASIVYEWALKGSG
ncbi:hypothetical protein OY671_009310, partial [Metschnikowia pulcherrima]